MMEDTMFLFLEKRNKLDPQSKVALGICKPYTPKRSTDFIVDYVLLFEVKAILAHDILKYLRSGHAYDKFRVPGTELYENSIRKYIKEDVYYEFGRSSIIREIVYPVERVQKTNHDFTARDYFAIMYSDDELHRDENDYYNVNELQSYGRLD